MGPPPPFLSFTLFIYIDIYVKWFPLMWPVRRGRELEEQSSLCVASFQYKYICICIVAPHVFGALDK
jgi:hypothetical protein